MYDIIKSIVEDYLILISGVCLKKKNLFIFDFRII